LVTTLQQLNTNLHNNQVNSIYYQNKILFMSSIQMQQYLVGDYYPNWIQETFHGTVTPAKLMKMLASYDFADRSAAHMKYRGHEIHRSKIFWVDNLEEKVPIYTFPAFQYQQVKKEYQLISTSEWVEKIQEALDGQFGVATNHVIGTLYQDGKDSIGWHNDKPKTLDSIAPIFFLSFGQQRPLLFRKNGMEQVCCEISMAPGSLFVLDASKNQQYQHCIAAESDTNNNSNSNNNNNSRCKPRISLIYRQVKNILTMQEIEKKIVAGARGKKNNKKRKAEKIAGEYDDEHDNRIENETHQETREEDEDAEETVKAEKKQAKKRKAKKAAN